MEKKDSSEVQSQNIKFLKFYRDSFITLSLGPICFKRKDDFILTDPVLQFVKVNTLEACKLFYTGPGI